MTEKHHAYERNSGEAVEYDPAVYRTYAGWQVEKRQVRYGQKAKLFTGDKGGVALFHVDQTQERAVPKDTKPLTNSRPPAGKYDDNEDDIPF